MFCVTLAPCAGSLSRSAWTRIGPSARVCLDATRTHRTLLTVNLFRGGGGGYCQRQCQRRCQRCDENVTKSADDERRRCCGKVSDGHKTTNANANGQRRTTSERRRTANERRTTEERTKRVFLSNTCNYTFCMCNYMFDYVITHKRAFLHGIFTYHSCKRVITQYFCIFCVIT